MILGSIPRQNDRQDAGGLERIGNICPTTLSVKESGGCEATVNPP